MLAGVVESGLTSLMVVLLLLVVLGPLILRSLSARGKLLSPDLEDCMKCSVQKTFCCLSGDEVKKMEVGRGEVQGRFIVGEQCSRQL